MGLEPLVDEIVKEGREKAEKIKKKGEDEARKIIENAKEKANEILEKAKAEAEREAKLLRKQVLSSVRLELKREELRKKQEILDEVFEKFKEKVRNMKNRDKEIILKQLLDKYRNKDFLIYSRKEDREIIKKLTDMEYGGEIDCIGGLIIESKDGTYRINLVFDEIIKDVYERNISEIHKILFE